MGDQGSPDGDQQYDRWSRPQALSRRGYVLALLVPLLIAATGFGVVSLVSSGSDSASGATVRLPVSGWAPGDGGGDALIQGILRLDDHRCVYLEAGQDGADPGKVWPVWPAGYRATREGSRLTLFDADGNEVAHDGDRVSTAGSWGPAGAFAGEPCLPDDGEVAVVESVDVLRP